MSAKSSEYQCFMEKCYRNRAAQQNIDVVFLKEILSKNFFKSEGFLCIRKGYIRKPLIIDLSKMPHLLVAGTTGSENQYL